MHMQYWCFEETKLEEALKTKYPDNESAQKLIKDFLYSNAAQSSKLFHSNEDKS